VTGGRSGNEEALAIAAEGLARGIAQLAGAAVTAALAAHRCASEEARSVPPRLLTYAQACEMLGICRATLYKLLRTGKIRNVRLGPQVCRIPAEELDRYVAALLSEQLPATGPDRP
jgi:excisionase family DNA binding protein